MVSLVSTSTTGPSLRRYFLASGPLPVLVHGITQAQMQVFALVFAELHEVHVAHFSSVSR